MDGFAGFFHAGRGALNTVERETPAYFLSPLVFLSYLVLSWASCADWVAFAFILEDVFSQLILPFLLYKARNALLYTTGGLKLARYDFKVWCYQYYRRTFLALILRKARPYYLQNKRAFVEHWPEFWSRVKDHILRLLKRILEAYINLCLWPLRFIWLIVKLYFRLCLWPLRLIWRIVKFNFRLFSKVTCFCIELYTHPIFFVLHVVGRVVPRVEQAVCNMEAKTEDLLTALKNPNLSIDTKLNYLLALKSDIKQKVVPAYLTPHLFHGIRLSITSQHAPIYVAGFGTLGHLLKRLYLQEQHGDVAYYARDLYPILLERLGDHKERVRTLASQAFTDLWPAANAEVEKHVLGTALNGKNPKAKEMSMLWLTLMAKEHGVLFRAHVPSLVACLEDADSNIRETAKTTVVELFKNAPIHAKLNLKTEMTDRHVRKSIMNAILPLIGLDEEDQPQRPASRADPSRYRTHRVEEDRSSSRMGQRKAEPRPASRVEHRPVSRVEQRPITKAEPRPVSRVDQRPVSQVEPRPVSRIDQRPVSKVEQPTSVVGQRPASRVEQHITSTIEPQPTSIAEQRPASRVEQHITSTIEPQPTSIAEQRPASRVEQHIASTVEPQPTSIAEQRTAHRIEQAPASEVERQPTSEMVIVPGEQTPTEQPHVSAENDPPRVQPHEVYAAKDIDSIVRNMAPCFEGRETEDNWVKRDASVNLLRRVTAGNAPHDYPQHYVAAIKSILDGIFKVVNSLRTQLATTGCCFIQEMATVCGSQIDSLVEPTMQNMLKICSGMKKITAGLGNTTVDTLLQNVSYNPRLLQHVASSFDDKSMQLRQFAAGWLKTLINKQAHNKSSMEHNGGMDLMVKSLRKGLSDANPGVREAMRSTFWAFASVWPARSEGILGDLDKKTRTLLEKDPSNPRNNASASQPAPAQRRPATSGSTTPGRSALKQAIAARRRAHQQTAQPLPRPGSAHAVLSDPRPEPTQPEPRSTLSSAPVRRGVKVTRPATAEPGRRPAPNEGRPNQARVASRWHPSSPTRAAPAANIERSSSKSPTKSPWTAPLSIFRREKTNEDLEVTLGANRSERKEVTGATWSDDLSDPKEATGVTLDSNPMEQKEATGAAFDASHPEQREATSVTLDASHPEQKEATGVTLKANRPELKEVADVTLNANRTEQQEVTDVTSDGSRIGKTEATPLSSPALMPNHASGLASEPDVGRTTLTLPEMALARTDAPIQKIRRATYEGSLLELRDSLTLRWILVEKTVVGRRDVKPEYADIQYARRIIASAKSMIQAHTETIDSYSYRKVQSLIAYHTDLFIGQHQYKDFLSVLLEELARNPGPLDDARKMRIALDYKTQVLKAIRFMFVYNENWYAELHADILMANMEVRRYFEPRHFLYTALNYAADDLLYACDLSDLVTAMVRNVNRLPEEPENLQGVIMAVKYITKIIRILNLKGVRLDDEVLQALGRYVTKCMSNGSTETRRFVMDLCTQVRDMAGTDEQFWELLGQPADQHARYVINYYVYRKPVKLDNGGTKGLNFESDSENEMM